MLTALHTDRAGRIVIAADYGAAALYGEQVRAFEQGIPLPSDARVVPLPDRDALGIDRQGRPRTLGAGRWAVAAILAPGYIRTRLPACTGARDDAAPLEAQGYTAVAAGVDGALIVAAVPTGEERPPAAPTEAALATAITAGLKAHPSSNVLRQLARSARDHDATAAAVFLGRGDAFLPAGSDRITSADLADIGIAHLAAGGSGVTFGVPGDPDALRRPRVVADAVTRIRETFPSARVAIRTNAASAAAIARVADAGADRLILSLASARPDTYERLHPGRDVRWVDVRGGIRQAALSGLAVTVELLVFPGLTDRREEVDALIALLRELPSGSALRLRDLGADPQVLLAANPGSEPLGVEALLARLHAEAPAVHAA